MAVARTQKEIRQRAPWWLIGLLFLNLALMAYDARDDITKQRMIRVWAQMVVSPVQHATSAIGGTGLGLSIAKAIAERLDGRLHFATSVGEGTTFFVDLPEWISCDVNVD